MGSQGLSRSHSLVARKFVPTSHNPALNPCPCPKMFHSSSAEQPCSRVGGSATWSYGGLSIRFNRPFQKPDPFSLGLRRFLERRIPGKNGEATPRMLGERKHRADFLDPQNPNSRNQPLDTFSAFWSGRRRVQGLRPLRGLGTVGGASVRGPRSTHVMWLWSTPFWDPPSSQYSR